MDDWLFRVLFRTILSQEGSQARQGYPHVAVQVDPEDDRIVNPRRARSSQCRIPVVGAVAFELGFQQGAQRIPIGHP